MSRPVDPRSLAPAYAATVLWLGVGAVLDIDLVRGGQRPITHVLRTGAGAAFLAVLVLHVLDVLGPLDPFRRVGDLAKRFPTER